MTEKIGVVIQARLGSTRLPKKILKPLIGNDTILNYLIKRLKILNLPLIVATTDSPIDDELVKTLEAQDIKYIRGSENDVLDRYLSAASFFGLEGIIRICSDNPFIEIDYLRDLITEWKKKKGVVDYMSFSYKNMPTVLSHFGIFAEIVSVESLQVLKERFPENAMYNEHVTIGLYSNPNLFHIELIPIDSEFSKFDGIRLTIDTVEDYENVLKIIANWGDPGKYRFLELANWIFDSPEIFERMKANMSKNKK